MTDPTRPDPRDRADAGPRRGAGRRGLHRRHVRRLLMPMLAARRWRLSPTRCRCDPSRSAPWPTTSRTRQLSFLKTPRCVDVVQRLGGPARRSTAPCATAGVPERRAAGVPRRPSSGLAATGILIEERRA